MNKPETQSGGSLKPVGSADAWKLLALLLAESAEVCLQNAHWEVSYGSGDLRRAIAAVQAQQRLDRIDPPNDERERWEPAAADARIGIDLNGWLPSAPRFGWAIS